MTTKQEDYGINDTIKLVSNIIKHRSDIPIPYTNLTIKNKNRIPNIVKFVIENVWSNYELKPLIVKTKRNKENTDFVFIIHLPHGIISYKEFKEKEFYFKDAINGEVIISRKGNSFTLEVLSKKLESEYPYKFNYQDYDHMLLPIPIGYSARNVNKPIVKDLAELYSILIGGIPRFGKSNMIHNIITSLLLSRNNDCMIIGIDYKESEYAIYLDKYGILATNESEALDVLYKLNLELDKRKQLIKGRYVKIHDMPKEQRPPFLIVFADEITEIQNKDVQYLLNRLPRLGGGFGFITIVATQKPSAKTFKSGNFTELRSLMDSRICFNVRSTDDSIMVLNNSRAMDLPKIKGRCIFQYDIETEIQTMYIDPRKIDKILMEGGVIPIYDRNTKVIYGYKEVVKSQNLLPPRQFNS
jgi:hypothetical protein